MAVLLQNRTISMILMVPDVDVSPSSSKPTIERLDRSDIEKSMSNVDHDPISDIDALSSMPVYQGSIVRIEPHSDDCNTSDLLIRIPNFQRIPSPSIDNDSRLSTRTKRRAPICPLLYGPTPNVSTTNSTHQFDNLNSSEDISSNRLTTGLRSLSRAFTQSCKPKRSSSFDEKTLPSALPDVEVMAEKLQTSTEKSCKHSVPKLSTPKIFFVKRKHSKIKKKPTSSSSSVVSTNTQTDYNHLTPRSTIITTQYAEIRKTDSPKVTSFLHRFVEEDEIIQPTFKIEDNSDDNEDTKEQLVDTMKLSFDVEQQFAAIAQLIADQPVSLNDEGSLSTHRYSTISVNVPEMQVNVSPTIILPTSTGISYDLDFKPVSPPSKSISPKTNRSYRIQTSLLQPDISIIRIGTSDFNTRLDHSLSEESFVNEQEQVDNQIASDWCEVTRSDQQTLNECYEVTYQLDAEFSHKKEAKTEQSVIPMKIHLDPREYKDLAMGVFSPSQNEYEQVDSDSNSDKKSQPSDTQEPFVDQTTKTKSCSVDDLSQINPDQTATNQSESMVSSLSSSSSSSRHCTLQRSNSYDGFGISIGTDNETRREHFIYQVENDSPGDQAGLKEHDQILCINGTPIIDEEYTVVLQLLKNGLQTDTLDFDILTNDVYEEFKSQID